MYKRQGQLQPRDDHGRVEPPAVEIGPRVSERVCRGHSRERDARHHPDERAEQRADHTERSGLRSSEIAPGAAGRADGREGAHECLRLRGRQRGRHESRHEDDEADRADEDRDKDPRVGLEATLDIDVPDLLVVDRLA